jgi:glycosyltransferase involved in cell wall biosynthesis/SAM-dependent methyltransferase
MDENGNRIAITFMPFDRPWTNVELIKDCGLIPYFLAKNHGFTVYMIGQAPDGIAPGIYGREQADEIIFTYPYFYYVDTLHFWLVKEYTQETRISILKEIASKADLLILRGCHASNIPLPAIYKQINTSGKVYCGLDANSTWMDTILWDKPDFLQFLKNTDVMATSCTAMAEYLSEKWPKHIETITNGTCDFLSVFQEFTPFSQRENTILTVGRLGTEQKATEVLVQAFLLIEKEIPDWKLKLIGSETPEFRQFMKNIFENHPELRNRVIEPGEISGRPMLYQEYKKAKIFALSSRLEGGTPNAAADALMAGLAMAVTDVDACEDMTAGGQCGLVSPIDDVEALAQNLRALCQSENLETIGKNAYRQAKAHYDMEKNVRKLYTLLFRENNAGNTFCQSGPENDEHRPKRNEDALQISGTVPSIKDATCFRNILPDFHHPILNKSRIPFRNSDQIEISVGDLLGKVQLLEQDIFLGENSISLSARKTFFYLMIGMLSHFSNVKPIHVAEIGCGDGKMSALIAEMVQYYQDDNYFTVITNLLGDGSQDQWAANVSKAEYPYRLSYLACDLQETNLRDKSFEIAILNGAANIDDPKAVYEEAKRMTKCPGYLLYIPSIEKKAQSRKLENLVKEDEGLVFHTSDQQSIAVLVR